MSLTAALLNSLSGLRAAQAGVDIVSRNVANAGTPGYTRKTSPQESLVIQGQGAGVKRLAVEREIDLRIQRELRIETASTAQLDVVAGFLNRIDSMFGRPEDETSLASSVTRLSSSFQALADKPESPTSRRAVLDAAEDLARDLNRTSDAIQQMRLEAEQGIAEDVRIVNEALTGIEELNQKIAVRYNTGRSTADLEDQRDELLDRIYERMDVTTFTRDGNEIVILTGTGKPLLDITARQLQFDARAALTPNDLYNADPDQRGVGTITLVTDNGQFDLLANNEIRSGSIAGLVELRDGLLTDAQAQLDELAAGLALSLSTGTVRGSDPTYTVPFAATQSVLDVTSVRTPGDTVTLTYNQAGIQRSITLTAVEDPSPAALPPNSFAIGATSVDTRNNVLNALTFAMTGAGINAALPPTGVPGETGVTISDGTDDGIDIVSFNLVSQTGGGIGRGDLGLNLFVDGSGTNQQLYAGGKANPADPFSQKQGFAQRIALNRDIDEADLVAYQTLDGSGLAPDGDPARPLELLSRLTEGLRAFDTAGGLAGTSTTVESFAVEVVSFQANRTAAYNDRLEIQTAVKANIEQRFDSVSGVNVDEEMTELLLLERTYSASAQVLTALQTMLDELLSVVR